MVGALPVGQFTEPAQIGQHHRGPHEAYVAAPHCAGQDLPRWVAPDIGAQDRAKHVVERLDFEQQRERLDQR